MIVGIHIQTHGLMGKIYEAAMIYIPSFIKTGSGVQKLIWGGYAVTQTGWRSHKHSVEYIQIQ
jgi:hypothetical protein